MSCGQTEWEMLVISRKIGESFLIGDDIVATVVDITGEKVVLGISAPRDVAIARTDENDTSGLLGVVNKKSYGRQYKDKFPSSES